MMELLLSFSKGSMTGEGRDKVGPFILRGKYSLADGKCHWTKRYLQKHDVFYQGFNEGKGIWGVWTIPRAGGPVDAHGGFHIWPEGTPDPTVSHLAAALELPSSADQAVDEEAPVEAPVATSKAEPKAASKHLPG